MSNLSAIEQISLLDLVLHMASCDIAGTHDCGDPGCIAPKLFSSYVHKHLKDRDRDPSKPILYGTRIILQKPSKCNLWNQFCKRTCPRSHEYQELEAMN